MSLMTYQILAIPNTGNDNRLRKLSAVKGGMPLGKYKLKDSSILNMRAEDLTLEEWIFLYKSRLSA